VSCPGEATLARYADRELYGEALHTLESHLVGCRACRAQVVALQGESLLLADVLQERARRVTAHAALPAAPEPGVAWGLPLAIAGATAVAAVVGALIDSRLPGGLDLLNPLRLMGVTEMVFDLVFMLRARAPGLVELALAIAAMASVSALLSFGVGAVYRRVFGTAALLLCLLAPGRGAAIELRHLHDGAVRIGAAEVVDGSLIVSSETLQQDGVVNGDLIVVAERVSIGGEVRGNLFAFARDLELTGKVTGSVIAVVEDLEIEGEVAGSAYTLSDHMRVAPTGRLARDLASVGNDAVLAGKVGRDVFFGGDRLELRGEVGRHVEGRWKLDHAALLDSARIGGDVDLWLGDPENLEHAPGAQIAGELRTHEPTRAHEGYLSWYRKPHIWAFHAVGFVAAFLAGLLVYALAPRLLDFDVRTARQFFGALGMGFIALVATPFALALVALTLVGIPIALFGGFAWVAAIYLAEIVVASAIGRWLLPQRGDGVFAFGRSLLAGLAVVLLATHIPFVGPAILAVVILVGLGALAARARDALFGTEREAFAG
jgi:cytoskeletal protein CcmA (bactofilin family)